MDLAKYYGEMNKNSSMWEIGARLLMEIQAKDFEATEKTFSILLDTIDSEGEGKTIEELKLRVLQILTNADRAAYNAGANPFDLSVLNMSIVDKIIKIKTKQDLVFWAKGILKSCISLVPDRNFFEAGKMKKALEYIKENCITDISRNEVALVISCSPSHLSRMFSKVIGHTFKEVVLKYRIEKAKEILDNSQLTITEVSYEIGYNDPNYFTATFKRITGITPSQYRKRFPH